MPIKGDPIGKLTLDATMDHLSHGDTITIGDNTYNGTYDPEYVEVEDFEGYAPVFTLKAADVLAASIARKTAVTVTSEIAGITDKAFTVGQMKDMRDGTTKLLLSES